MTLTARFPNADESLAWEIDVDPVDTPRLQSLDTEAQQILLTAVRQDMQRTAGTLHVF